MKLLKKNKGNGYQDLVPFFFPFVSMNLLDLKLNSFNVIVYIKKKKGQALNEFKIYKKDILNKDLLFKKN